MEKEVADKNVAESSKSLVEINGITNDGFEEDTVVSSKYNCDGSSTNLASAAAMDEVYDDLHAHLGEDAESALLLNSSIGAVVDVTSNDTNTESPVPFIEDNLASASGFLGGCSGGGSGADDNIGSSGSARFTEFLDKMNVEFRANRSTTAFMLNEMSVMFEEEFSRYLGRDPDPLVERNPHKIEPSTGLASCCRALLREELFICDRLLEAVIQEHDGELRAAALRLLCSILPALDLPRLFDSEEFMETLLRCAEQEEEWSYRSQVLRVVACGLESPEIMSQYRERAIAQMPSVLSWLKILADKTKILRQKELLQMDALPEDSVGSAVELHAFVVGRYSLAQPLSPEMQARLLMSFLQPLAVYQDVVPALVSGNALAICLQLMNEEYCGDIRLSFEALRLICAMLCHKRLSMEFLDRGGIEALLAVRRPSVAATAVPLALYYLVYFEESGERLAVLDRSLAEGIMAYALWAMERSHDNGRYYALQFLSRALPLRKELDLFDRSDGPRRLCNLLFTAPILVASAEELDPYPEARLFHSRLLVRTACACLRTYLELHLLRRAEAVQQPRRQGAVNTTVQPVQITAEALYSAAQIVQTAVSQEMSNNSIGGGGNSSCGNWQILLSLNKLGIVDTLVKVAGLAAFEWTRANQGRAEAVRHVVGCLRVLCLQPRILAHLIDHQVEVTPDYRTDGINLLLTLADNEEFHDTEVQKYALSAITLCVNWPMPEDSIVQIDKDFVGGPVPVALSSRKRRRPTSPLPISGFNVVAKFPASEGGGGGGGGASFLRATVRRVWAAVRSSNGLLTLMRLLNARIPLTDADWIRGCACAALLGLSRDQAVSQMLAKLPLITKGQLATLTREPVLADRLVEHAEFCRLATRLTERVMGRRASSVCSPGQLSLAPNQDTDSSAVALERLRRAEVVARTRIEWDPNELILLMHGHLQARGFLDTAARLVVEAKLPPELLQPPVAPTLPALAAATSTSLTLPDSSPLPPPNKRICTGEGRLIESPHTPIRVSLKAQHLPATQSSNYLNSSGITSFGSVAASSGGVVSSFNCGNGGGNAEICSKSAVNVFLQIAPRSTDAAAHAPTTGIIDGETALERLVGEYLAAQHALCPHPMSTVSMFSLLRPHRCPEPRRAAATSSISCSSLRSMESPMNLVLRLARRSTLRHCADAISQREDRRLVFSRFRPLRTLREDDHAWHGYTCCRFALAGRRLLLGATNGNLVLHDAENFGEVLLWEGVLNASVETLTLSPNDRLLGVCSAWGTPATRLFALPAEGGWVMDQLDDLSRHEVMSFEDESYLEFEKCGNSRFITTKDSTACLYDVETKSRLLTLSAPDLSNGFSRNKATLSWCGSLALNDGVLWDVRQSASRIVHKFDKLQPLFSGLFHPNGLEVVVSSEVWDLRSFRLLRNVSALEGLQVQFSPSGAVILGALHQTDDEDFSVTDPPPPMATMLRTVDAADYSLIASVDLKRRVRALDIDSRELLLSVVECQGNYDGDDSHCRVYELGRRKVFGDDVGDEETEDEAEALDEEEDDDADEDDEDGSGNDVDFILDEDSGDGEAAEDDGGGEDGDALAGDEEDSSTESESSDNNDDDDDDDDDDDEDGDDDDNDDDNDNLANILWRL